MIKMVNKRIFAAFAAITCVYMASVLGQDGTTKRKVPSTRFTCSGRAAGYYADMDTGCQVYHMCDGLGRQFSYTCPNTTLFQQRMLICDHWYMVNCSMSERDYTANLLIGQRDKPFVSDEEMRLRTPRPDILSVPPNDNYYDGLREAESKFLAHPGNSIVGIADSISNDDVNGLDSAKRNYRPPTSWSTSKRPNINKQKLNTGSKDVDNLAGAASQEPEPSITPSPRDQQFGPRVTISPPSRELSVPLPPLTTNSNSDDIQLDISGSKDQEDAVVNFIKRFDPNSPDSHKTAMSKSEIIKLNEHLPAGQVSAEEDHPKKSKEFVNKVNNFDNDNDKTFSQGSRFDSVNTKVVTEPQNRGNDVPVPDRVLRPPKIKYSNIDTTTMGPPIYYEWKWAVPAFDLELPKANNGSESNISVPNTQQVRSIGESPFRSVTRSTISPDDATPAPKNVEYNISSYFVPDYVFPLDKEHPGYDSDDARTSFQVAVARPGRSSYGENPNCPQCHPGYVVPGTCEPCIVKR